MIGGRVLDLSALLGFARQNSLYATALVWTAVEEDIVLLVPSTAVTLTWARLDAGAQPVLDVLLDLPVVVVDDLTRARGREIGDWLRGRTVGLDVAHTAVCARERGWAVVTAEPAGYDEVGDDVIVESMS